MTRNTRTAASTQDMERPERKGRQTSVGLLLAVWLAGNVADLITTREGLQRGLKEMNPIFARLPFRGMVLLKSGLALGIAGACHRQPHLLRQLGVGQWSVVGWNLLMLARVWQRDALARQRPGPRLLPPARGTGGRFTRE